MQSASTQDTGVGIDRPASVNDDESQISSGEPSMHNPITLAIPEIDKIGQDISVYVKEKEKRENRKGIKNKPVAHRPHP